MCHPFSVDDGESVFTKYGFSHEWIVEKVAERRNSGDRVFYEDIFEEAIKVTDNATGETKSFNCTAEVDVVYLARRVEG